MYIIMEVYLVTIQDSSTFTTDIMFTDPSTGILPDPQYLIVTCIIDHIEDIIHLFDIHITGHTDIITEGHMPLLVRRIETIDIIEGIISTETIKELLDVITVCDEMEEIMVEVTEELEVMIMIIEKEML